VDKRGEDVVRVWIIGAAGSGKSVAARLIADKFQLNFHELDSFFWGPGWKPRATDEFQQLVRRATAVENWVIDGNYVAAEPVLRELADLLLWIDIPLVVSYPRVLRRTLTRIWSGQELWSGNRETWRNTLRKDGMPCYALFKHRRNQRRFAGFWSNFPRAKFRLTRLRSMLTDAVEACHAVQ
jgi:hypothetical protein